MFCTLGIEQRESKGSRHSQGPPGEGTAEAARGTATKSRYIICTDLLAQFDPTWPVILYLYYQV
jgi:hypothetical protein